MPLILETGQDIVENNKFLELPSEWLITIADLVYELNYESASVFALADEFVQSGQTSFCCGLIGPTNRTAEHVTRCK
jgi:methionine synthase I (cobalamin-dependent)